MNAWKLFGRPQPKVDPLDLIIEDWWKGIRFDSTKSISEQTAALRTNAANSTFDDFNCLRRFRTVRLGEEGLFHNGNKQQAYFCGFLIKYNNLR